MPHALRPLFIVWLLTLASCRCDDTKVVELPPARWVTNPAQLAVADTYVGQQGHATVEVSNLGGLTGVIDLSIDSPFELNSTQLELAAGDSHAVVVTFVPTTPGHRSATLRVGPLRVPVEARALAVPVCEAVGSCEQSQFEHANGQCVVEPKEDGAACQTTCIESGTCATGVCVGQFKDCDDQDACTVDGCSQDGTCSHAPRECVSANRCQVARCDPSQGCAFDAVLDGTLCGTDECIATEVDVCIAGQCVRRTRPAEGRCANRWVPVSMPVRAGHAVAYDVDRQKLVVFSGSDLPDTWEWDGTNWLQRTPAASPSARWGHRMVYDAARKRTVLFGGDRVSLLSDTWEWDGTTWLERSPATVPPPRSFYGMAYDESRQRVVMFGGFTNQAGNLSDTWEWDGTDWLRRTPATSFCSG
jgi:hypothetical protein